MVDTTTRSNRLAWASTVVRVALGLILIYAGFAKLVEPSQALRAVQAYRILPPSIDDVVAIGLPLLELTVGVLLVIGLGTRPAAWVAGGLMVVFIAAVASAWIRGLSIDCGCFGGGGDVAAADKTWRYTSEILRDTGFLALALWLIRFPASHLTMDDLIATRDLPDEIGQDGDQQTHEEPQT
jgi:uncharacterized membrane protein YphA (DoxX/SURF4 family)